METRRDVFQAIADPTRRAIIHLVAGSTLNLNAIAGEFNMSRPAISQHIKILTECGLIVIKQQGRERFCEARLEPLNEVTGWAEKSKKLWMNRFHALEDYLGVMKKKEMEQMVEDKTTNHKKLKHKKNGKKKQK